jgi:hypothetical protein
MLWTFPARAQPPIVEGRKRMFAAERIPAASSRLIQSAAAIDQSPPLEAPDAPLASFVPPSPPFFEPLDSPDDDPDAESAPELPASPEDELPESVAAEAFVRELLELDRSFFAQPEPLKWTAGGTKALRSVSSAPQAGQNFGGGASMPWMNSVRVEQVEQT